jgi:predicted small secreted protein
MKNKKHIIEAVAICIVLSCIVIIYVNKVYKHKEKPNVSIIKEEFGVIMSEDIYINNMDKNAKYTSHGRLILSKSERGW